MTFFPKKNIPLREKKIQNKTLVRSSMSSEILICL